MQKHSDRIRLAAGHIGRFLLGGLIGVHTTFYLLDRRGTGAIIRGFAAHLLVTSFFLFEVVSITHTFLGGSTRVILTWQSVWWVTATGTWIVEALFLYSDESSPEDQRFVV